MLSPQTIRAAARAEAEKGVEVQRVEFREFGLLGEWGATGPGTTGGGYRTMDWSYERRQLGVVREMVRKGELGISPRDQVKICSHGFGPRSDHDA